LEIASWGLIAMLQTQTLVKKSSHEFHGVAGGQTKPIEVNQPSAGHTELLAISF